MEELDVDQMTEAHVTSIENRSDLDKRVELITPEGLYSIHTKAIIYSTGARERHRFETGIQGDRLSGVYTAGEAQTLMDIYGVMPGRRVVIVGSGDIGLIMARRFALEGADVIGVIEMLPYPGGLTRNVVQCLHDFDIPLHTQRLVKEIRGDERVEEVVRGSRRRSQPIPRPRQRSDLSCCAKSWSREEQGRDDSVFAKVANAAGFPGTATVSARRSSSPSWPDG